MSRRWSLAACLPLCAAWSPLLRYSWTGSATFTVKGDENRECDGSSSFSVITTAQCSASTACSVALALEKYSNNCYTRGKYNNLDFTIQTGSVSAGAMAFDAFKIGAALTPFSQFLGSRTAVWMNFTTAGDYVIYGFDAHGFDGALFADLGSVTVCNSHKQLPFIS